MLANLGTAFAAAWVVGLFQEEIEGLVALAVLLPVVAGMGGTGGIQTLTVITRAIALGEIEFSSGLRAVGKECLVGLFLGAVTGLASAGITTLWHGNPVLGMVIFVAMVSTMAVAGLLAATLRGRLRIGRSRTTRGCPRVCLGGQSRQRHSRRVREKRQQSHHPGD